MIRGSRGWTAKLNPRLSNHKPLCTIRHVSPPSGLCQSPVPTVPTHMVKFFAMAPSFGGVLRVAYTRDETPTPDPRPPTPAFTYRLTGRCPHILPAVCNCTCQVLSSTMRPPQPYSTSNPDGVRR